jgi:hypothetical protein
MLVLDVRNRTDALQDLSRLHSNRARHIQLEQQEDYRNQLELQALMADGTPRIVSPFARPAVSDDTPPPYAYEMIDAPSEPRSTVAEVSDAVKGATQTIRDAIEIGKKPGMPLSVLRNIAREAPLGSLLIAFLLGVAVARRHSNSR